MAGRKAVFQTRWNKTRERVFLEHLAASSNVAAAERVALMTAGSAYRRRQKDAVFHAAWLAALREGYARLEHAMLERALQGTPVVRIDKNGTRTETIEYADRIAMTLLGAHRATVGKAAVVQVAASRVSLKDKLDDMARRMRDDG